MDAIGGDMDENYLDDVDSAAIDAVEEVRDTITKKAQLVFIEMTRPSVLFRPVLTKTATAWKVVYGEFQSLGQTPAIAMANFDTEWIRRGI